MNITRNIFKTKLWRSEHRGEAEEGGEKGKGKSSGGKEDKSSSPECGFVRSAKKW